MTALRMDRNELCERVVAGFAELAEVYEIHAFGRDADNTADQYSDLDLIISSSDMAATERKYRGVFETIAPIIGTHCIVESETEMAEMIMLRGVSPYQKIDFSIVDGIESKGNFGPFKKLYSDDVPHEPNRTKLPVNGKRGLLLNHMHDILFSVPRFTKCLFRQDFDMYRRWTGVLGALASLLYEKHFGWERQARWKLNPHEHKLLWQVLSADEMELMRGVMPLDGEVNIAISFGRCVKNVTVLCQEKATFFGVDLNSECVTPITMFMDKEIDRYLNSS